jgi:hypothetical protein
MASRGCAGLVDGGGAIHPLSARKGWSWKALEVRYALILYGS